ncbi:DUF1853 family protein [Lacinutrix cladophorae]
MNDINLQYLGFLNTPNLWLNPSEIKIEQLEIGNSISNCFTKNTSKLRLGKLVERFVSHQLQQDSSISILAENLQIQDRKITIGEIDCLLKQNNQPIHLEIVYKFYLYDATVGNKEIDHWIGPNRKDSLIQKLSKLTQKQLPLLYHSCTKATIEKLDLHVEEVLQKVCFKAQLFLPYNKQDVSFKTINSNCVKGFYIRKNELDQFADYQFYIPEKRDWLTDIPTHNFWQDYHTFLKELTPFLKQEKAPLCWLKKPNAKTEKCFVVWW